MSLVYTIDQCVRSSEYRRFLKYSYYVASRFIVIDLFFACVERSFILDGLRPTYSASLIQLTTNLLYYFVGLCPLSWLTVTGTFVFGLFVHERVLGLIDRRQSTNAGGGDDRWIWFRHLSVWRLKGRHGHIPYDVLSLLYYLCVTILIKRRFPFKSTYMPVIVHDFDWSDDELWPRCSLTHTIGLYWCRECTRDNRLIIYRTSAIRRRSWRLCSWKLNRRFRFDQRDYETDEIKINAFQSGGLIFVYLKKSEHERSFLEIYNLRTNRVVSTRFSFLPRQWSPFYFFRDHVENERPRTVYIRIFYSTTSVVGGFAIGYCLLEFCTDVDSRRFPRILESKELHFPPNFVPLEKPLLHRSSRAIGVVVKLRHPQFEHVVWRSQCVYDTIEKSFERSRDYERFAATDRLWMYFVERFLDRYPDTSDLPFVPVFNSAQVIALRSNWALWTTRFEPKSLKEICTERVFALNANRSRIFGGKKLDLNRVSLRLLCGLSLEQHFAVNSSPIYNVGL